MNKTTALLVTASLVIAISSTTHAATDPDFDQIIVTGTRTPIDVNRLASATTIIDRAEIDRRQARYVTDLLRVVPGFSVSHTGVVGSQTQVRVRGAEANHVLVLVDGVRVNDPATGDEFRWEHLSTGNIDRIEIVRGPQSALWGSDAVAAVVNVITRSGAETDNLGAYVEGGADETLNVGTSGAASFGAWTLSGSLESLDTGGQNISRTGTEDDGAELFGASLGIAFRADGPFSFRATVRGHEGTSRFDPVDFVTTGLPTDGNVATESDGVLSTLNADYASNDRPVNWHLRVSHVDSEHENLVDDVVDSATASERLSFLLQSDISIGENVLALALENDRTDFSQRGAVNFGDPNQDQDMRVSSAIAEYQYLAGEKISLVLGARYDNHSDFDNVVTGRLATAWQWSEATRVRASIGTGQKTPTFTERYGFFPQQFIGNPDLKPETSVSYDLGIDQSFLGGAFVVNASVYWQRLEDEINGFVFDPVTFLATAENRTGKSDRSGVELAAAWQIGDQWSARASYTYTDSSEQDAQGQDVAELRRPRHAGGFVLEYSSPESRLDVTLSADYGGTRLDTFFPPFPEPPQTVTLGNYWLVDVTAQYRLGDTLTLYARGTNLLDEDYEQVFGYRTPGVSGLVGLRASFGR